MPAELADAELELLQQAAAALPPLRPPPKPMSIKDVYASQWQYATRPHPVQDVRIMMDSMTKYDGNWVQMCPEVVNELFLVKRINLSGRFFGPAARKLKMMAGECHENSRIAYLKHPTYRIVSGYAVCDSQNYWTRHSWCINAKDEVVETTRFDWKRYYGAVLDKEDMEKFMNYEFYCAEKIKYNDALACLLWYIPTVPYNKMTNYRWLKENACDLARAVGEQKLRCNYHYFYALNELLSLLANPDRDLTKSMVGGERSACEIIFETNRLIRPTKLS